MKLSVLCDAIETQDKRVGKFIAGLREDLRKQAAFNIQSHSSRQFFHLALTLEKYEGKKRIGQPRTPKTT